MDDTQAGKIVGVAFDRYCNNGIHNKTGVLAHSMIKESALLDEYYAAGGADRDINASRVMRTNGYMIHLGMSNIIEGKIYIFSGGIEWRRHPHESDARFEERVLAFLKSTGQI